MRDNEGDAIAVRIALETAADRRPIRRWPVIAAD